MGILEMSDLLIGMMGIGLIVFLISRYITPEMAFEQSSGAAGSVGNAVTRMSSGMAELRKNSDIWKGIGIGSATARLERRDDTIANTAASLAKIIADLDEVKEILRRNEEKASVHWDTLMRVAGVLAAYAKANQNIAADLSIILTDAAENIAASRKTDSAGSV